MTDIVRLTIARDEIEADMLISRLRAEGIAATQLLTDMATASIVGAAPGSAARGTGGMREVLVSADAFALAAGLLGHISKEESTIAPPVEPIEFVADEGEVDNDPRVVTLYDVRTGDELGHISEFDLSVLQSELQAESDSDDDFYFNEVTLDTLQDAGGSAHMLNIIALAINTSGEADIRWSR